MEIDIQIRGATLADLRRMLGLNVALPTAEALPVNEALEARIEAHQAEVDEPTPEVAEPAPEVDEKPVVPASRQPKETATVTLADGSTGRPDDTVHTASEEIGIILSCSRGSAVVVFEDGREERISAKELEPYTLPKVEAEPVAASGDISAEDLRSLGRQVLNKLGAARTQAIVKETSGAAKLSEVPPAKFKAVHSALSAALL